MAKSVLVTSVGTGFPPLAALVTAPLLAQGLGLEARGQVAAAQAAALLTVSLMAFGLPEAITYYVARGGYRRSRSSQSIIAFTVLAGVAASLLVVAASPWLADGNDSTTGLIQFAALSIVPALLLGLVRGNAAGHEMWTRIAAERIVGSAARMIGTVVLLLSGHLNPQSATALMVLAPLLGVIPYLKRGSSQHLTPQQTATGIREVASYSGRTWIGAVSGILLMRIDQVLLVPFAGASELGLYAVAVAISEVPLVINSAIRDVSFARNSGRFSEQGLAKAARMSLLLSGLTAGAIAVSLPWGIPTLFGEEFGGAVPVTLLLLVAVVIGTPGSIAGAGLSAQGRPGLRSASLAVAAVVNIVVLLLVASHWGAMGAALATLVGNLISSNLNIHWLGSVQTRRWRSFYAVGATDAASVSRFISRSISQHMPSRGSSK